MDERTFNFQPAFIENPDGKPITVSLDLKSYVTLLVKANVMEPHLWPPGLQSGAAALARIREIESGCVSQHGEFDWGKLSPIVQDEYDGLCCVLDSLQENGAPVDWDTYKDGQKRGRG